MTATIRWSARAAGIAAALAAAACTPVARAVRPEERLDPAGAESVVIGRLNFTSYEGGNAFEQELRLVERNTGREWKVELPEAMALDNGRRVPFLVTLPSGSYRLTRWSMAFSEQVWSG